MTSMIENERWRGADRAADFLSVDREVCRRAFHREPEERVREVVRWVLSERDLPEHDPERMIERWAREQGAGVYDQNHRTGGLERLEEVLVRSRFGREPAAYGNSCSCDMGSILYSFSRCKGICKGLILGRAVLRLPHNWASASALHGS